jgi:hypothetical protein
MKDRFIAAGLAGLIALAVGCSRGSETPTTPSAAATPDGAALPDGSTLKATAPTQVSPTGGGRIDTTRPNLVIGKSNGRHVAANFQYVFEISTPGGTVVHTSPKVSGGDQISYDGATTLSLDTRYRWRARAEMGQFFGPWSNYAEFLTIDYRGLVPRPANGQWPSNGNAVVAYVAASFRDYLRPTGSLSHRIENMEFLRDRIIETAICGGMDVTWNLKRGIGPHSHDAVAWRDGGVVRVMDIASGFDDFGGQLSLHWLEVGGAPGYDPYTNHPGC